MENKKLYKLEKIAIAYHPGEMLEEKLSEMGISARDFAKTISVSEDIINCIISGKSSITPDIADRLEAGTLIPARMWMKRQRSFDKYQEEKIGEIANTESKKMKFLELSQLLNIKVLSDIPRMINSAYWRFTDSGDTTTAQNIASRFCY